MNFLQRTKNNTNADYAVMASSADTRHSNLTHLRVTWLTSAVDSYYAATKYRICRIFYFANSCEL